MLFHMKTRVSLKCFWIIVGLPEEMKCYNGVKVDGMEALRIYLNRFAYLSQYSDIMSRFGRDTP